MLNKRISVVKTNNFVQQRSKPPEVFLRKGVLKMWSKFTGEHPCRSVTSVKLQSNFIEITLRHGCSPVNLLRIFRTPFPRKPLGSCFCQQNHACYMYHIVQIMPHVHTFKFINYLLKSHFYLYQVSGRTK